ncbi:MAG: hypothetical protein ACE5FW_01875 [Candidatus Aenigmatarchaeota archaeon]
MKYRYVTNRTLPNSSGKADAGRLKAFVLAGSDTAEVDYTCPECGHSEHLSQPFKRPLSVKCSKCGQTMKAPKLKGKK